MVHTPTIKHSASQGREGGGGGGGGGASSPECLFKPTNIFHACMISTNLKRRGGRYPL